MNALDGIGRYRKEVIQVSTLKNNIKVQYLYFLFFKGSVSLQYYLGAKFPTMEYKILYFETYQVTIVV